MQTELARRLWVLAESYHAVIYFAPEKKAAYESAGLKGGWMGYFASRCAALGPAQAEVVAALFYNFHPAMVARAIPDAWRFSTPERVLEARYSAARDALARLLEDMPLESLEEARDLAHRALRHCEVAGRPMYAAHSLLDWPDEAALGLWHACTLWREYRGDAHVAALVAAGLDGCEAHVTLVAEGEVPESSLRPNRGWSEPDWTEATERLRRRGLVDDSGRLSPEGARLRRWVEDTTDARSLRPWEALGERSTARFVELMKPVVLSIVRNDGLPFPNPMGLGAAELDVALTR